MKADQGHGFQGTGTCRMGMGDNPVVDSRLRVHGVENLRVVDCPVMPTPMSGNTNGPAMVVAQRAAELILEHRLSHRERPRGGYFSAYSTAIKFDRLAEIWR